MNTEIIIPAPDGKKEIPEHEEKLFHSLTPRQVDLLRYLSNGKTHDEIAQKLQLSISTVDRHVGKIYERISQKFGSDHVGYMRARLIQYGVRSGQIELQTPIGPFKNLTSREMDICRFIYNGKSNAEITTSLKRTLKNIEAYKTSVHKKLYVRNDFHLVARLEYMRMHGMLKRPGTN